jgi:hypothetical protein
VDATVVFQRRLLEPVEIGPIVCVVEKDGVPVVAALNDMNRDIRKEEARLAGRATYTCP